MTCEKRLQILHTDHMSLSRPSSTSDWLCQEENLLQPISSTTQILVVTRHQYGISSHYPQTSFRGEKSGDVTKSRLFTPDIEVTDTLVALAFPLNRWIKSYKLLGAWNGESQDQ